MKSPLRQKHEAEFAASAIHRDLWGNFITLETNKEVLDYLLVGDIERNNGGRVAKKWLDKYAGLESGWLTETLGSDFIQLKPDKPRTYTGVDEKERVVKYESPAKHPVDIIRLRELPHWITGEKPVENFYNDGEEGWICEGAKKAASLLSLGLPAIALAGIFNTHVGKGGEVIPALSEYIRRKKIIKLVFDAPDKLTQHEGLENAYRKLKNLILQINPDCEVRICCWKWWQGKGIDDAIAAGHLDRSQIEACTMPYYESLMFLNTNIPAYKRIIGKRYLDLESVDYFIHKYVALIAGKDAGKSTTIAKYLKTLSPSEKVLSITHRIKLGMELARNLGLYYLNGKFNTSPEFKYKLILCINSLSLENVKPEDWEGAIVILDEIVQLCDFLYSGTIKKSPEILQNFRDVLMSAKKVIIADADLDYKTLKLLDELTPSCDFLKSVKIYEMKKDVEKIPMEVHKVSNRKVGAAVYERALTSLVMGKKILVMVDSQRPTSKLSAESIKRALEKGYRELTGKDIKGLALYAKATKNKGHEASQIINGINVIYEYDFVVYTTVIGTGVSLDKDKLSEHPYFDEVIGGYSGAISINDVLQGLHRYRRGVPRIVFLPNKGIAAPHAGSTISKRVNKINTWKVKKEILQIFHSITPEVPDTGEINRPLEDYYCAMKAFAKYECDHYFDLFCKRALKDYEVVVNGQSASVEVPAVLEKTVAEVFDEYAQTTVSAKVIEDEAVYEELKAKPVVLQHEAENLEKTQIAKKYQIESHEALINKELVELDRNLGYFSGIKNHYFTDKLCYAQTKGERNIKAELLDFEKFRKDPFLKTRLLIELGAHRLRETTGEILHRLHPVVQEIVANYKRIDAFAPGIFYRHLHIVLNQKDPMKLIDSLALKQGMERKSEGRKTINKQKISGVSYAIPDTIRYEIFAIWDENNEIDAILSQVSSIRENESKLLEKLRSSETSEEEKQELRLQLSKSSKREDALKERLVEINEVRNQRREKYATRQSMRGLLNEEPRNYPDHQAVFAVLSLNQQKEVTKTTETNTEEALQPMVYENNELKETENIVGHENVKSLVDLPAEQVEDAFNLLNECDSVEMLADLRQYADITPAAFKAASRRLEVAKKQQIRQWVIELNAVA